VKNRRLAGSVSVALMSSSSRILAISMSAMTLFKGINAGFVMLAEMKTDRVR